VSTDAVSIASGAEWRPEQYTLLFNVPRLFGTLVFNSVTALLLYFVFIGLFICIICYEGTWTKVLTHPTVYWFLITWAVTYLFNDVLVRYVVLDRHITVNGRTVAHRILFRGWALTQFVLGFVTGTLSAITRLSYIILFAPATLACVEETVFPTHFSSFDSVFTAYHGLLAAVHTHKHPVMRVAAAEFADKLAAIRRRPAPCSNVDVDVERGDVVDAGGTGGGGVLRSDSRQRQLARNRWHLARTLIIAPPLAQYRVRSKKN
jgi:hypothetical protein